MTGRARSVMAPSVPKNRGNDAEIRPQAADDRMTSLPGWRRAQHRAPPVSMLLLFEHSDFDIAEISHPTPDAPKTPCCTPIFLDFEAARGGCVPTAQPEAWLRSFAPDCGERTISAGTSPRFGSRFLGFRRSVSAASLWLSSLVSIDRRSGGPGWWKGVCLNVSFPEKGGGCVSWILHFGFSEDILPQYSC